MCLCVCVCCSPRVSRSAPASSLHPVGNPMVLPSSGGPSAILMPGREGVVRGDGVRRRGEKVGT